MKTYVIKYIENKYMDFKGFSVGLISLIIIAAIAQVIWFFFRITIDFAYYAYNIFGWRIRGYGLFTVMVTYGIWVLIFYAFVKFIIVQFIIPKFKEFNKGKTIKFSYFEESEKSISFYEKSEEFGPILLFVVPIKSLISIELLSVEENK